VGTHPSDSSRGSIDCDSRTTLNHRLTLYDAALALFSRHGSRDERRACPMKHHRIRCQPIDQPPAIGVRAGQGFPAAEFWRVVTGGERSFWPWLSGST
jgi:hypothetical protein